MAHPVEWARGLLFFQVCGGVGLVQGVSFLEGLKLEAAFIDSLDGWVGFGGDAETVGGEELGDQEAIGSCDLGAEAMGAGCRLEDFFRGFEVSFDPELEPAVFLFGGETELAFQSLDRPQILVRLGAIDAFAKLDHFGFQVGVLREEGILWKDLVQIQKDGHGLAEGLSLLNQSGDFAGGVQGFVLRRVLFSA